MRADLWEVQCWILKSITTAHRIAVKACHASGKTFAAALAVLWFLVRYPDGIVITTSATWKQVERVLWGEIRRSIAHGSVSYPEPNLTELEISEGNYAIGLSTNEAERFSGFHAPHILVIVDEAPGVRPVIYEGIEGIRAGGDVRVCCLGNPVIASGPFYEAFTTQRNSWATKTISAFDTPNLRSLIPGEVSGYTDEQLVSYLAALSEDELDTNERMYLTTRRWTLEKWDEWGQHGHPLWDARVMGRFPKQDTHSLYPLAMVEEAANRELNKRRYRPSVGIDVAGPGEAETVMYIVEGPNIMELHYWNDPDPRGKVLHVLRTWRMRDPVVNVDEVGMGYYFAKHIEDAGYTVNRVNVGSTKGVDTERFTMYRGTLHWALRERFEEGSINGLTDEKTVSQLTGIRYDHDPRGRVVVESKDVMRKRGMKSPDRAEALMLAYASERSFLNEAALV